MQPPNKIQNENRIAELESELQQKNRLLEIEAALEKVRIRATAMKSSHELAETSAVLFQQLENLNIRVIRSAVGIIDDERDAMELWLTIYSETNEVTRILDYVNLHIHPVFENIIPARKENKPYVETILKGKEVQDYYETMSTYVWLPHQTKYNLEEHHYSFFFSEGSLNVVANSALSTEECNILIRFALVFGLMYTRFLDLQRAEAQSKDIIKQTSLDRVRAEIASMRSQADLQRITPLIWNELTKIGVPFTRCGVFILDVPAQDIQIYLANSEGEPLAVLNLPFNANELTKHIAFHWRKGTVYSSSWKKDDFNSWIKTLVEYNQVPDEQSYRDAAKPPDELDLYFVPFSQGMLFIGNHYALDKDDIDLALSLGDAFSIAYARYEDFVRLEKTKRSLESTLTELKTTQAQLIQSEKMASLGELTAGIAHEIKNPLNFINNFSELNKELIQEMKEEIEKGNLDEVKQISDNIAENELKIIFHGKRADGIVKGMLQHSRSGSAQKEMTDINALADEYLRLAFHGLRAKDKSFNAAMKTDFDKEIGTINIIPQDIGRVILNLITNGFYAANDKKKKGVLNFEPAVTITTRKEGKKVLIKIRDNGSGIPQTILDKIFQPFFTTKPTGQGTGLGLSISYDIIKAHGGEMKVETREGEFAEFIIILPV